MSPHFYFPMSLISQLLLSFVNMQKCQDQTVPKKVASCRRIIELTSCVVQVLCGFSTECLKTSESFSLLFENTMKTSCCFIVSFRWWASLYVFIIFRCICFSLCKVKLMVRSILVLNWFKKFYYSLFQLYIYRYISVAISYLLRALGRVWNFFHKPKSQF